MTAMALAVHPALGGAYLVPVSLATAYLVARNLRLLVRSTAKQAHLLFHTTNLYLALVMLAICVDVLLFL